MLRLLIPLLVISLFLLSCATTPVIEDGAGSPLAGSIASLESVDLNGRKEWITVRGRDATAPVLLFLAGGPGCSELATVRRTLGALEDHFVVVVWDQPGAGKSFDAIRHEDLSLEVYVEDAVALIGVLRARFDVEKVYLLGESWGSVLGTLVAAEHPDLVEAFFGTGQMVYFLGNDLACYELILSWARAKGDAGKVRELELQGPPPYYGPGVCGKLSAFLMETFDYMREMYGVHGSGDTIGDILSPEYDLLDKARWIPGLTETLDHFYPKLWDLDLRKSAPVLAVPCCFLIGRHDVNASQPLFLDYYGLLQAPRKEVVWFERSGHTPWSSEPEAFVQAVLDFSGVGSR